MNGSLQSPPFAVSSRGVGQIALADLWPEMPANPWFSRNLLNWYRENQRALPWRSTTDPYKIWLSEVILQQTRVDQGLAYWERFVERYRTVAELAAAPEDAVLRLWQGLGYYSRARNLRTAAQQVMDEHGGQFPREYEALLGLKGVGEYTAAAIGSISFNLIEPVVDGNVYRVLARVFGIGTPIDSTAGRKEFRALAATLIDPKHPGDHNQAVMELGATVCTPKKPLCDQCPILRKCIAQKTGQIQELPFKAGKTKVRMRYFNYLEITTNLGRTFQKRNGKDIWQGLYEFPLIESTRSLGHKSMASSIANEFGPGWVITEKNGPVKHVLSHQVIQGTFWNCTPPKKFKHPLEWIHVPLAATDEFALPRLIERYLEGKRTK